MDSNNKLIIYAPNIHQGGGKVLLAELMRAANNETHLFADHRMLNELPDNFTGKITYIRPTILDRLLGEFKLKKNASIGDVIFCMGNLPPIFRLRGNTILFLQNRYLVDKISLVGFRMKVRLRIFFERIWLKFRLTNVDRFIVQSPTMRRLLIKRFGDAHAIYIKPFAVDHGVFERSCTVLSGSRLLIYDFVYPASGEPHKNHKRLIEAWILLARDGIFPSLCITLDDSYFPDLHCWIGEMVDKFHLKISNVGNIPHKDLLQLYKKCGAAIYPSTLESFGMPLVEAKRVGIPILASELDYVRDILNPKESFDPNSAISIARSIRRYLALSSDHIDIINAKQFMNFLVEARVE